MKLLSILITGLLLAGCATTKPAMPSDTYSGVARSHVAIEYCNRMGWLTPDIAASGKLGLQANLNQYSYDYERLNNEARLINGLRDKPSQGDCNNLAMEIQGYNQRTSMQNQAVRDNQRETQEILNSTKLRNTYCNRIGTQTLCNTY